MPTIRENLIAAKALIDTPEKWIKGTFGENGCYCALGAVAASADVDLWFVGSVFTSRENQLLRQHLPDGFNSVPAYNDHPDTTHADIMALFDRAIAASP